MIGEKSSTFLIVGGFLLLAGCSLTSGEQKQKGNNKNYALSSSGPSLRKLNNWLGKTVKGDDPVKNLAEAVKKLNNVGLFDGALVPAINVLKDLSDANEECDSHVLGLLRYVQVGTEQGDDNEKVDKIVRHLVGQNLIENCEQFVDKRISELRQRMDPEKVGEFIRLMQSYISHTFFQGYLNWEARKEDKKRTYVDYLTKQEPNKQDISGISVVRLVGQMAEKYDPTGQNKYFEITRDPKTGKEVKVRNYDLFARAFDAYLTEPCKHYMSVIGNFYDNSLAVPSVVDESGQGKEANRVAFMWRRSVEFQDSLLIYKTCRNILMMSENKPKLVKVLFDRYFPK